MDNFLKNVSFFANISPEDLARLINITTKVTLAIGEELFREGDMGRQAYIIQSGEIEIFTYSGNSELHLALRQPGEVIGEMSLLDQAPRMASARARANSLLLSIQQADFDYLLASSPTFARDVLYNVTHRWRDTEVILRDREQQILEQSATLEQTLAELRQAHDELEMRVQERTAELASANRSLKEQIRERERAEKEIQRYRDHLEELVIQRTSELNEANQKLRGLNERLQAELLLARRIQQGLLPNAYPGWTSPELVCYSSPAREVGGDFYAYYAFKEKSSSKFAFAVGDVSGKGMPAALLMAVSLTAFQSNISKALPPHAFLAYLDRVIAPYTYTTRQNCALCYAEIQDNQLQISNAGCVMPIVRRANGHVHWLDIGGMPLGTGIGAKDGYIEISLTLNSDDLIILTSDGIIEANSPAGEMFGFDRFEQAVMDGPADSAATMLNYLRTQVANFVEGQEPHDDMTIIVLRR